MDLRFACDCYMKYFFFALRTKDGSESFKTQAAQFLVQPMGELCNGQLLARAAFRKLRSCKVGKREHFPATVW